MEPRALDLAVEALLAWYAPRRRAFPWRRTRDPYRILVSEVMLQQTQAARAVPAYRAFLRRFPDVRALADAPRREVLIAWDGLGYHRRAVALSESARTIVREHGGRVPSDPGALRGLPGIGPYTAAAVASIAFDVPSAAIDTNTRRIVARVFEGRDADACSPARIRELADHWLDRRDPGSWNQALMDLGREVCRPRPRCEICPLADACRFRRLGREPTMPHRRQPPFEGSMRQVRGAIVRALRSHTSLSRGQLVHLTGHDPQRVEEAVRALVVEGIAEERRGRLRLAS